MASTTLYPALHQESEAKELQLRPREVTPAAQQQFNQVSAVPQAVAQAPAQMAKTTMYDFEPQGSAREALTGVRMRG